MDGQQRIQVAARENLFNIEGANTIQVDALRGEKY